MLQMNDNSVLLIREQTARAMEARAGGKSTRDILVDIYVKGLPEKTENQGRLMADHIIDLVAAFTSECEAALQDADQWLQGRLEHLLSGKNLEERCQLLFQLSNAIAVINASTLGERLRDDSRSAEDIAALLGDKKLDPAACSVELEEELRTQATEALKNCGIVLCQLDSMADMLEQTGEREDVGRCIVDFGIRMADYKALAAMTAYVAAKNGTLDDIPPDISLDEITISVCAIIEVQRVAAQVAEGNMAEDIARFLIKIISLAAAWLAIFIVYDLAFAAGTLLLHGALSFTASLLLAISAVVLISPVIFAVAHEMADFTADASIALVKVVARGLRKLASWVLEKALPTLVRSVECAVAFASGLFARGIAMSSSMYSEQETASVKV